MRIGIDDHQEGELITITLDEDWISDISMDTYSVQTDPSGNTSATCISSSRYSRYLEIISNTTYGRLAQDGLLESDGSLKSGAEPLAALLICDLIQSGSVTDLGIMSENFGGTYSYQKSALVARDTKSAFMQKYEQTLAESLMRKGKFASAGQARSDYQIELAKLSQGDYPSIADSSANFPTL